VGVLPFLFIFYFSPPEWKASLREGTGSSSATRGERWSAVPQYSAGSRQIALYCARPTRAFRGRALREQKGRSAYSLLNREFHKQGRVPGRLLHLLAHLFPLFRHLRLAWSLALRWLRNHHRFEAPLQKRFSKHLRTPNPCFELRPSCQMHFIEFCT